MAPAYPDIAVSMNSGHMAGMMPPTTMLGSPDSGLSNDHSLRPILSNDFNSGSAFLPANNEPHAMADPLGKQPVLYPETNTIGIDTNIFSYSLVFDICLVLCMTGLHK